MRRFLPWVILLFPALELWVMIRIGTEVGALATLGLLFLSAVVGFAILRLRGVSVARNMQAELNAGRIPSNPIIDTFCLMAAGVLFIFPGFVSDALALLLLIPVTRHLVLAFFVSQLQAQGMHAQTVHFESNASDAGGVTWTCTTYGGSDQGPTSPYEPRGNAVVIDCEPEQPASQTIAAAPNAPEDDTAAPSPAGKDT